MGAVKRQGDEVGARPLGLRGPGGRVLHGVAPGIQQQARPVVGAAVAHLDRDDRPVGRGPLEVQEGQTGLATHGDGAASGAALAGPAPRVTSADLAAPILLDFGHCHRHPGSPFIVQREHFSSKRSHIRLKLNPAWRDYSLDD